ncbi:hypothetical protein QF026_000226 [Streptomyces aurantiacus]|nr:hypothetical protein [Streptomyces aurantiacus]
MGPLFGISKSAADRVIDHIAPLLALAPVRRRHPADTVLIVDGTLVPTRDRSVVASSKNYRCSTNHQVVIDANTRLLVAAGRSLPGNRHDARAYRESGVDRCVGLFAPEDVVLVGVHCPLQELERREQERGDRPPGLAARRITQVHAHSLYDIECDTSTAGPADSPLPDARH